MEIGQKVKVYNMYTKRYRTRYIVLIHGNRIGLSKNKNGGASSYVNKNEI